MPIWALSSNGAENLHKEVTARRPGQRFSDRVAGLGFGYGRGKAQPVGDAEGVMFSGGILPVPKWMSLMVLPLDGCASAEGESVEGAPPPEAAAWPPHKGTLKGEIGHRP